jgi:hypothetical protein
MTSEAGVRVIKPVHLTDGKAAARFDPAMPLVQGSVQRQSSPDSPLHGFAHLARPGLEALFEFHRQNGPEDSPNGVVPRNPVPQG